MSSSAWSNPRLTGRIPELDGIRGLAILLVLVWHYFVSAIPATPGSWQMYAVTPFRLAWSGVDLFFVLSGFLIGGILLDAKYAGNYYRTFYFRRIHRIFPLYFILLATFLVGLYAVGQNGAGPLKDAFNHDLPLWSFPLFFQNVFMTWSLVWGPAWMGATWSLAVEEQFYLLLPWVVRQLSLKGIIRVILGAIAFAPMLRAVLYFYHPGDVFIGPYTLLPCRADALGWGVLVALACRNERVWSWMASNRRSIYLAFSLLGLGLVFHTFHGGRRVLNTVGYSWLAAFYALLLLLVVVNPGRIEKLCFGNFVLVRLGTIAYALYIFHPGVNILYHWAILGRRPIVDGWPSLCVTLLSLMTVIVLSELSWRVLEQPLIRRARCRYRYAAAGEELRSVVWPCSWAQTFLSFAQTCLQARKRAGRPILRESCYASDSQLRPPRANAQIPANGECLRILAQSRQACSSASRSGGSMDEVSFRPPQVT